MAFHWQSKASSVSSGVEDMVLLSRVTDGQIVDNLHKRYNSDLIYTYIGPVLIAINPYKSLPYFTEKEMDLYHGATAHENPPHIYALAESMFQNMLIDEENQCVIISGESGAGKTESSKLLMNYIAAISGKGGSAVEHVKRIILESNPLLESFGNAKTLRNNNSSRFGKYFEIKFSRGGQPVGGNISNFLLEKSRVVGLKQGERNFHIFYQITKGTNAQEKEWLGMAEPQYFYFLNQSDTYTADGVDDVQEFQDVKNAMNVCEIDQQTQNDIFQIVAGILHLGNVEISQDGSQSAIADPNALAYPAYLLGVDQNFLRDKITSRLMATGGGGQRRSLYDVPLNREQAINTRDALAKSLYSRMFDYIVTAVNRAIYKEDRGDHQLLSLGVLDIYGFEIFEKNGFEQLCINYVNEKLQQVFIELTLKSEQEEYVREGIQWTPIEYFNNKVVVDLIEGKRPVGVMAVLDDVCIQLHAQTDGADQKFVQKLGMAIGSHPHYQGGANHFVIKHYAGTVEYDSDGFCEANKDTLFKDLVMLMQSSKNNFIRSLFPDDVSADDKKRPTTAGFKIRNQSNELVTTLMKCTPSYIRCIKPNDRKRAKDWDSSRVEHQVRYLNLRENINVRRAGFCYRNTFEKFLRRFAVLSPQTFPRWNGPEKDGVSFLMQAVNMDPGQWQLGRTKVFIKAPESLFLLEEMRERKYHEFARKIQRAYRRWRAQKYYLECKKKAMSVFYNQKERRRFTLNRDYLGDYISYLDNPVLRNLVGKNEKVLFSDAVKKYDRRFKSQDWDLFITETAVVLIGLEKVTSGPEKGKFVKVVKRRIALNQISGISLSTKCDDFLVMHVSGEFDNVFENVFKTELTSVLADVFQRKLGQTLNIRFSDRYHNLQGQRETVYYTCDNSIQYTIKKTRWESAGTRTLHFVADNLRKMPGIVQTNSKGTQIGVPAGLPKDSQPNPHARQQAGTRIHQASATASRGRNPMALAPTHISSGAINQGFRPPMPMSIPAAAPFASPPQFRSQNNVASSPPMSALPSPPGALAGAKRFHSSTNSMQQSHAIPKLGSQNSMNSSNMVMPVGGFQLPQLRPSQNVASARSEGNLVASGASRQPARVPPPARPPPPAAKPNVERCRALYAYQAQEADELAINIGDIITVISKENEGWWTGVLKGKRGLFPANYVEKL